MADDDNYELGDNPVDEVPEDDDKDYEPQTYVPPRKKEAGFYEFLLDTDLRDLELYIRGIYFQNEIVNGVQQLVPKKRENHFLNDFGIDKVLSELQAHTSKNIIMGRTNQEDFYILMYNFCKNFTRFIYKNLKQIGMSTIPKKANAKLLCQLVNANVRAAYSRSIGGRENDLTRTNINLTGDISNNANFVPGGGNMKNIKNI